MHESLEIMKWLIKNLPEWPVTRSNVIHIPIRGWHWLGSAGNYSLINVETGEYISKDLFHAERDNKRLQGCGMSFEELMKELNM